MKTLAPKKLVALVALVIAVGIGIFALIKGTSPQGPSSFSKLVALSDEELAEVDVALINFLAAEGLPGANKISIKEGLALLDQWTKIVKQAEAKYFSQFQRDPARYDHSFAKFRAVNLALTLKQDIGCDYNMDLITSGVMTDITTTQFFRDSNDLFLHGLTENRKGSCASLPVLMVAIGRRCGYPLSLVTSKGHLFCRWDDGRERFNIEIAVEGVDSQPDSYYRTWPHAIGDEEIESEKYLKSLTPAEELGVFAQLRALCLQENGRFEEAASAYELALRSFPQSVEIRNSLNHVKGRL